MQLARIVFAGALLFGAGCVLPEEGDVAIDEGVDQESLDDSTKYTTEGRDEAEELDVAIETTDYAIDEAMAPSIDVSAALSEIMSGAELAGEQESSRLSDDEPHGWKKNWKCTYCYKRRGDKHGDRHGDKECYYGKDREKYRAKRKAEYKCENEHDHGCKFYECRKIY